uniref:INO80 complex subunit B-like conserved region domain-containing protein n=1 Tax=Falco tinnunculus TaxID=100819 RepID=A0A8C4UKJ6_FALTI
MGEGGVGCGFVPGWGAGGVGGSAGTRQVPQLQGTPPARAAPVRRTAARAHACPCTGPHAPAGQHPSPPASPCPLQRWRRRRPAPAREPGSGRGSAPNRFPRAAGHRHRQRRMSKAWRRGRMEGGEHGEEAEAGGGHGSHKKKHKKHKKKHKKKHHHEVAGPPPEPTAGLRKPQLKLKIKLGGQILGTKSVPTFTVVPEAPRSPSPLMVADEEEEPTEGVPIEQYRAWLDEDSNLDPSPLPDLDSENCFPSREDDDEEEERWLDALEKGELDDNGELKKEVDESLLTARQKALLHKQQSQPLLELPMGYKAKELTEEMLVKREERARKRRLQAAKKAEENKNQTIERLTKTNKAKAWPCPCCPPRPPLCPHLSSAASLAAPTTSAMPAPALGCRSAAWPATGGIFSCRRQWPRGRGQGGGTSPPAMDRGGRGCEVAPEVTVGVLGGRGIPGGAGPGAGPAVAPPPGAAGFIKGGWCRSRVCPCPRGALWYGPGTPLGCVMVRP